MDCFLDFCLACDKQTLEGLYCSQACRLADLEKAGSSGPASPSTPSSPESESWQPFHQTRNSGFSLPQSFDFNAPRTTNQSSQTHSARGSAEKVLSPSTSRTSLSSAMSNASGQTSPTMSETVQNELQGYVSSFDAVRELKRRSLSNQSGH